jgi:hypothetical protein
MERRCDVCGVEYEAKRPNSRFCGDTCRKRAQRNPSLVSSPPDDVPGDDGEVTRSTSARLVALDVVDEPLAAVALALARRLDSPRETGSAVAALGKQLAVMLDDLERRGKRAADPLDELRARRAARGA